MRSFIRIRPVLMGDMQWLKFENTLFFIMGYLAAMKIRVTLF